MTYDAMAHFAQTYGMLFFVALFGAVLAYALWPSNKRRFDAAARIPLLDERPDAARRPSAQDQVK